MREKFQRCSYLFASIELRTRQPQSLATSNATRIGRMLRPSCNADFPAIRSLPSPANLDGEFSSPTGYAGKGVRPSSSAAQRVLPMSNPALMTSPTALGSRSVGSVMRPGPDATVQSLSTALTAVNFAARRSGYRRLMEREPEQCTAVLAKRFWTSYTRITLERFYARTIFN